MEVETKFRVLNEEFTIGECNNPIEAIKTRLKSPKSIVEKMIRLNFPLTVEKDLLFRQIVNAGKTLSADLYIRMSSLI